MKYYLFFLFSTIFSLGSLSMTDDDFDKCKPCQKYNIIKVDKLDLNEKVKYVDLIPQYDKSMMTSWDHNKCLSVRHYIPSCHREKFINKFLDKVNANSEITVSTNNGVPTKLHFENRVFLWDFHAVLQFVYLITPNGKEYKHVSNIINIIFRPDVKTAFSQYLFGERAKYAEQLKSIYTKIAEWKTNNGYQTLLVQDKEKQEREVIEWVTNFALFFMDKKKEYNFEVKYQLPDVFLREFIEREKDKGGKMIVLSGGRWSPQVKAFLDENYPGIFTNNEMAIELSKFIPPGKEKLCQVAEGYSFIQSGDKSEFLSSLVGKGKKYEFIFIDDNINTIRNTEKSLRMATTSTSDEVFEHFILMPYPFLIQKFNHEEFILEVLDLFNNYFEIIAEISMPAKK